MGKEPIARRIMRKRTIFLLTSIAAVPILAVGLSPSTPVSALPGAQSVQALKNLATDVKDQTKSGKPFDLSADWPQIKTGSALAGRTLGIERVTVERNGENALVRASVPLKLGLWANVEATVTPNGSEFPHVSGWIGQLPVPGFLVRWMIGGARMVLGWRGFDTPEPREVLSDLSVGATGVTALVTVPRDRRVLAELNSMRSAAVDPAEVSRRYCALAQQQRDAPALDLPTHVQRAFAEAGTPDANRAAFVALAMIVATPEIGQIAGNVRSGIKSCQIGEQGIKLLNRLDLAKHWTLSAALAATLGSDVSGAMGVWKEVADSSADGTGFSFVDLAADRSGLLYAGRAVDEAQATEAADALKFASEAQLLPVNALAFAEGMPEADFKARFVDIESPEYTAMVERIDRVLRGE
jgi:hypothetical protein